MIKMNGKCPVCKKETKKVMKATDAPVVIAQLILANPKTGETHTIKGFICSECGVAYFEPEVA